MYDTKSGGNPGQFPAANNCEAVMAPRREQHRQELNADPKRTQFHPDLGVPFATPTSELALTTRLRGPYDLE